MGTRACDRRRALPRDLTESVALSGPTPGRDLTSGSPARAALDSALEEWRSATTDVPNIIDGREVRTGDTFPIVVPHSHATRLGQVHRAGTAVTTAAVDAALAAARKWGAAGQEERAAPFREAAQMLEVGPWRDRLVAAVMLEMSKTADQADGDAACETVDLLRAALTNAAAVGRVQPTSPNGVRNHLEYRPLEGFVLAISPFNCASMNHLAFGPALLGNIGVETGGKHRVGLPSRAPTAARSGAA